MYKILLILFLNALTIQANDVDKLITEANKLFEKGTVMALKDPDASKKLYKQAALTYNEIIKTGIKNPDIYKNLGNAWFFSGDKGRALLNYHRGRKLSPSDPDINHNIEFVRSRTVDIPPEADSQIAKKYLLFWHSWNFSSRLLFFVATNIILWTLLGFNLFKIKRQLVYSAMIISIPVIFLGASLLTTVFQLDNHVDGVITEREVTPRQGNGYIYEMALSGPLHSGCEFTLLEKRSNWYYIELAGGSKCWIPVRTATMIE